MKAIIKYNRKASETIDRLVGVARTKFGIELIKCNEEQSLEEYKRTHNTDKVILFGSKDDFNLSKEEQCEYFEQFIDNTLIMGEPDDYELVIVKNPTCLMLGKDWKRLDTDEPCYHYISNKIEWRINYSFGKVNSIYNKNLTPTTIFGKADITQWSYEQDKEIRKYLITTVKLMAEKLRIEYPKLEHFGIDIIQDKVTGEFYFLELNKAHSLNEENCEYFLKGWMEKNNLAQLNTHSPTTTEQPRSTFDLSSEERNLLRSILARFGG
jgi:hypothetical protein